MAVAPLFVADMATLKQQLRLTGVPASTDADEMISAAVLEANSGFRRRLGNDQVTTLLGYSYTETPSTNNEVLRLVANQTEVKMVKAILLRVLPAQFIDGAGNALQNWHEEAPFRHMGPFDRRDELKQLNREIEENLQLLEGSESITSETKGHASTISPVNLPPRPAESIFTYPENT